MPIEPSRQTFTNLTAVILAGGLGTRLRSVVADRPKVMALVRGRPFITYLLDQLADAGLRRAVICTGYLGEQIEASFGAVYRNMALSYSQETQPLGTAGAVRLALPLITTDTALVMNGNSYCDTDLGAFWHQHETRQTEATLQLARVPDTARYGRVQVDGDGQVLSFEEKGSTHGAGWINAGLYLLRQSVLSAIPAGRAVSIEREVFPALVGRGLAAYLSEGRFLDIGLPESYAAAEDFFAPPQQGPQA